MFPKITGNIPSKLSSKNFSDQYANIDLVEPQVHLSSSVDFLLGVDIYPSIVDHDFPAADQPEVSHLKVFPVSLTASIESIGEKFWHLEKPAMAIQSLTDDGRCEEMFLAECMQLPSGQFSIPILYQILT